MRRNECQPNTRDRSRENEGSSGHDRQAFVYSLLLHRLRSYGRP